MFNKRIGEALANAGHDVTIVILKQVDGLELDDIKFPENIKIYPVNVSIGIHKDALEDKQKVLVFEVKYNISQLKFKGSSIL